MERPIRVLICEGYPLLREGIKAVLRAEPSIEVVGEAKDGREAAKLSLDLAPDVVILDISLSQISGIDATRRIKRSHGQTKILVLTGLDGEESLLRCLDAGASGYVTNDVAPSQLIAALKTVGEGSEYLSPGPLRKVISQSVLRTGRRAADQDSLTEREREVLVLIAQGYTVKEVASRLGLGIKTVDTHKYQLMRKLDIHNKSELIRYAIREKLISLEP